MSLSRGDLDLLRFCCRYLEERESSGERLLDIPVDSLRKQLDEVENEIGGKRYEILRQISQRILGGAPTF